jgi:hypothetical protein
MWRNGAVPINARWEWWPMDATWQDSRNISLPHCQDPSGQVAAGSTPVANIGSDGNIAATTSAPQRLALFGLPPALAEPVTMLAEILGWQVVGLPPGPAMCPPARLCLAMVPAGDSERPPIVAWSPELNLNELICRAGLSIMDQPICISRVEQMLQALVCEP